MGFPGSFFVALISCKLLPHPGSISHILPMKKLRHKVVKLSTQGHIASEEWGQGRCLNRPIRLESGTWQAYQVRVRDMAGF